MSRIGRQPIPVPTGVTVNIDGSAVVVKGKLGELSHVFPNGIAISKEDNTLAVSRASDSRQQRAFHGLTRSLLANIVAGVSTGFSKKLELVCVGFRCDQRGRAIQLAVGFSHRVLFIPPDSIEIKVTAPTAFTVSGIDKQLVGEVAAKIRAVKPPEPYKGKGIRYVGEYVKRKAGKAAVK